MNDQDQPKAVRINNWGPDEVWPRSRSRIMLAGVFLIVLGLLLGAGQLFSQAQIGASAFFLALGVVLVVVGLRDRSNLALYAGIFVTALALSSLLSTAGLIKGEGWGTLLFGVAIMAAALVRSTSGRRWSWILAIGALLALWGGSEVLASNVANFPADRLLGPLLIVLLGIYIVTRTRH